MAVYVVVRLTDSTYRDTLKREGISVRLNADNILADLSAKELQELNLWNAAREVAGRENS